VAVADRLAQAEVPVAVRVLAVGCIRPLDASTVIQAALETGHLIVVEDHNVEGGLATQVADVIADFSLPCSLRRLGLRQFLPSGTAEDLKVIAGIDQDSIEDAVEDEIRAEVRGGEDAFVTFIHELIHNRNHSRFRDECDDIIRRLRDDEEYMNALRERWKSREVPAENLPTNEDLRDKL
jgi:hypothetical protein